ncbi:MAG: glycoside hydrolase domain-containing protein [Bryobacteraceae bacterium]
MAAASQNAGSSKANATSASSAPANTADSAPTNISGVWANEGGDKVAQDELRATKHVENKTGTILNRAWDGTRIKLSGAENEVVSFNLVLEAANAPAAKVTVEFDKLSGPNGALIQSRPTSGNGVFSWVNRPIELFYARYQKIEGLSFFGYGKDESQIPVRFRAANHKWTDRPDHDKMYPDALVPLELVKTFSIARSQNQSIWADIYIPKAAAAGAYTGAVVVRENGVSTRSIPVQLTVSNFSLPDVPAAKTLAFLDNSDIEWRYETGHGGYAQWDHPGGRHVQAVMDRYFQLFHRHKIATVGQNECPPADEPCESSLPRLNGSLYTAAHGYDGPGLNTPTGVFSIGAYGTWGVASYGVPEWKNDEKLFREHLDRWARWFSSRLPGTQYFLYLQDEPGPSDYPKVQKWASWIRADPGPGRAVPSFATLSAVNAQTGVPDLSIAATQAGVGSCPSTPCNNTELMNKAYDYFTQPGTNRRFWMYNDGRPGVGSSMIEDDGVAFRTFPWAEFKKGIDRWFYWESNVSSNYDTYSTATSWGSRNKFDNSLGMYSDNTPSNGNGLLVYPGTDKDHPANSYGVDGPVATIRLKEWRRGVQDVDYLALAKQIDPAATSQIVSEVLPKALWEYTVRDPSYVTVPPTWSSNPDDWEAKRAQLATIISHHCSQHAASAFCR